MTLAVDDDDQVEAAYLVASQCELDAVGWTDSTRESVRASLIAPDAWREQHLLARHSGEVVGLLVAECDRDGREVFLDAYGVGELAPVVQRALLERGLAAARALAAADPVPPGLLPDDPYALSQDVWQVVSANFAGDRALRGGPVRPGLPADPSLLAHAARPLLDPAGRAARAGGSEPAQRLRRGRPEGAARPVQRVLRRSLRPDARAGLR